MSALGKPSKELVLDEVNKKSIEVLSFAQIEFAMPEINPGDLHDRNTRLLITDIDGAYNFSSRTVFYNRLDLQALFVNSGISEVELTRPEPFTSVVDLLDELNDIYGLALAADDIEDIAPVAGDAQTLTVKATSYAYLNKLDIVLKVPTPELETVIPNNILDGLNYPDALDHLIRPIIVQGDLTGAAVENGFMLEGHPVRDFNVITNNELTVGVAPRAYTTAGVHRTFAPIGSDYSVELNTGDVLGLDVSMEIIADAGTPLDEYNLATMYDIYVILGRKGVPAESITLSLAYNDVTSTYVLVNEEDGDITDIDVVQSADGLVAQLHIVVGEALATLTGAGQYELAVISTRKSSMAHRLANIVQVSVSNT